MFGIGETELLIIVAFGFMIFGPDKLPGMGRTIGRALRQFREAQEGFTEVVQAEVMDPLQQAMNDPLEGGTRNRRATAQERAAALAQDADIEQDAAEAAPARKETFAERKARLAAEREAREAERLAQAQATDADVAEAEDDGAQLEAEAEAETPAEEPAKPDTSAAALYGMSGRSSYAAAKQEAAEAEAAQAAEQEAEAQAAQAEAAQTAEQGETVPEAQAEEAQPDQTEDGETAADAGKEDGSEQA